MAYNPNIPGANDLPSVSQGQIQTNFADIQTLIDVNHVNFASSDRGKHKFITLPVQGSTPAFSVGEIGLYNKAAFTTLNELFIVNSAGTATPMTASLKAGAGWSYLPSGILIKWGNGVANGLTTVTFNTGATIPAFTQIFSIQVCTAYTNASDGNGFVRLNNFLAPWTQFTVYGSARTTVTNQAVGFEYLAIGI